jgi:uncharacterized protein (TIGR03000 family)
MTDRPYLPGVAKDPAMRLSPFLLVAVLGSLPVSVAPVSAQMVFGSRDFPPSYYGYNLDEYAAGYYGGGSYNRYYNYGRGVGVADMPGPVPTAPYPWFGPGKRMPTGRATAPVYVQYPAPVNIVVWVPEDAEVWVDGNKTTSTGAGRVLITPPLEPTIRHTYEIKARWQGPDGQALEQTQVIGVYAGDRTVVRFPAEL